MTIKNFQKSDFKLTFAALKKVISILLIAIFLVQSTSQVWIWVAFKINQDYITANLCINRFDAIPVCKGSCWLKKELNEDQKQQQKFPDLKTKDITLFCQSNTFELPEQTTFSDGSISFPSLNTAFITSDYLSQVFHPPAFIG